MERLSERLQDVVDECIDAWSQVEEDIVTAAIKRLAAYEETGLEPEDIKELCTDEVAEVARTFRRMIQSGEIAHLQELLNAEQEGRLVELPCKVGDTVWCITVASPAYKYTIKPATVKEFVVADGGILDLCVETDNRICYQDNINSFFLTREEAEKALKGGASNAVT